MKSFQTQLLLTSLMVVFLFISQICNIYAQEEWCEPLPLTDSLVNNTNPDIKPIYINGEEKLFMVWEKSIDSASTSIYMKNIIGSEDVIEVLSDENVHYTHPKICPIYDHYGLNDTIFFLFYETDQSGNSDIYYLIYTSDGNFSAPVPFSVSPYEDHELDCNLDPEIVWIKNADLMYANYSYQTGAFIEPVMIDTIDCSNPKIANSNYIMWEKKMDTLSHIYRSDKTGLNLWTEPILIYDSGFSINLNKDAIISDRFTWSAFNDSTWKLFTYNVGSNNIMEFDIVQEKPFDPAITEYVVCLKSGQDLMPYFITFPYEDIDHNEIFINHDPWTPNFVNLSNSGTENQRPNIFHGESDSGYYNCWYMYNVWESFQNEHWQLYYSKTIMCCDGVEENESEESFIQVSPNPVSDKLNISYVLDDRSNIKINIVDLYGKVVTTLIDKPQNKGEQSITWTPSQELTNGVYFVLLRKDNEIYTQKIIKSY